MALWKSTQTGVTIQTVIEYREGQYFVLAVNLMEINWVLLMKWVAEQVKANQTMELGQNRSINPSAPQDEKKKKKKITLQGRVKAFLTEMRQRFPSRNEVVAYFIYFMYSCNALIAVPVMRISYFFFLRYAVNKFILNIVTDGEWHPYHHPTQHKCIMLAIII